MKIDRSTEVKRKSKRKKKKSNLINDQINIAAIDTLRTMRDLPPARRSSKDSQLSHLDTSACSTQPTAEHIKKKKKKKKVV